MEKENRKTNQLIILNLIQDLQRLPLFLLNSVRGRFQIKSGMTLLWRKTAFTLIELLVVVLIVGILSSIAVPQYQEAVERARSAEAVQNMNNIQKAIDVWILSSGYPTTNVNLIGCYDKEGGKCNVLDIDIENSLICDQNDGPFWCRSQNFAYSASCQGSSCGISALRLKEGKVDNDIQIEMNMDKDNEVWSKWCNYNRAYSYTKKICDGLISYGWESNPY